VVGDGPIKTAHLSISSGGVLGGQIDSVIMRAVDGPDAQEPSAPSPEQIFVPMNWTEPPSAVAHTADAFTAPKSSRYT
jgi:hypothetical protein